MRAEAISEKSIVMKSEMGAGMRAFGIGMRAAAFAALYLTLTSALGLNAARLISLVLALCVVVPFLVFDEKKIVRWGILIAAVGYTIICVASGFFVFADGAAIFYNAMATAVNMNMHSGWAFVQVDYNIAAELAFVSVIAIWLSIGTVLLVRKSGILFIFVSLAITIAWMMIGLFPQFYGIVPLVISWIGILAYDRGFSIKSAWAYVIVMIALSAVIVPSVVYDGSDGVRRFRNTIADMSETVMYGSDTLPQGKLSNAGYLHDGDDEQLVVTMSARLNKLYLKGFIGSDLNGSEWQSTDKNRYVEDGYQGLLDYVGEIGLPYTQYAKYSALCGNADKYSVTVQNVGANRKYMYVPYGLSAYSSGNEYYDLNIRNGVFASRSYTYSVFAGDGSGEWVTQGKWLTDASLRSVAMNTYLDYETEYRSFVYDTYTGVDEATAEMIREALYGIPTNNINTAARLLRSYFEENFVKSDEPDKITGGFLSDFFGGKIHNANAVYFASAATYAFRAFGFAARYAEGYLVETDAEDGAQNVTVTSKNAHAWTEVYFDGIGWLPIEVTFEVKDPNIPVDPENPENPDTPPEIVDPETPELPDNPDKPDVPDVPTRGEQKPMSISDARLLIALKILLPFVCVLFVAVALALALALRRYVVLRKKHKMLDCNGEEYGRAAYTVVKNDCKSFGGFSEKMLEENGIGAEYTKRFMQLVERCVYGGCVLNDHEKSYIMLYIRSVAVALEGEGRLKKFKCKYIKCLGI